MALRVVAAMTTDLSGFDGFMEVMVEKWVGGRPGVGLKHWLGNTLRNGEQNRAISGMRGLPTATTSCEAGDADGRFPR